MSSRHPMVKWAQRSDKLYITIELPDAQDVKLKLNPHGKFLFYATAGADNSPYEIDLDLLGQVDVDESKASIGSRNIRYLVKKAEKKWWSRLTKQAGKPPIFLKVDWDKWIDEDDENPSSSVGNDMDFGDFDFTKLGTANAGGVGDADGDGDGDDDDDEIAEEVKGSEGKKDAAGPSSHGEDEAKKE